jgi:hypothetical protein
MEAALNQSLDKAVSESGPGAGAVLIDANGLCLMGMFFTTTRLLAPQTFPRGSFS